MSDDKPRIVGIVGIQGGQMTGYHLCECGQMYVRDKEPEPIPLRLEKNPFFTPPAERRRYALLQAAATICGHTIVALKQSREADAAFYVDVAEELLAEIERREAK